MILAGLLDQTDHFRMTQRCGRLVAHLGQNVAEPEPGSFRGAAGLDVGEDVNAAAASEVEPEPVFWILGYGDSTWVGAALDDHHNLG